MLLKIIFAGTPLNAASTLAGLIKFGFEVVTVITRKDAYFGRKKLLVPSPVAAMAESLGIPCIKTNQIDASIKDLIRKVGADLGVIVAYGSILDQETLDLLRFGWVNIHYSLLPKWRGASPVQSALLNGDGISGVTLFQLDEGMDTGPIWGQVTTEIAPKENAGELLDRLSVLGLTLLQQEIPRIFSGTSSPKPQFGESTYAPKFSRVDMKLDFNKDARQLETMVRAANPEPLAWCQQGERQLQVLEAAEFFPQNPRDLEGESGGIHLHSNRVLINSGDGSFLELMVVKPSGKTAMPAADWYRGLDKGLHLT